MEADGWVRMKEDGGHTLLSAHTAVRSAGSATRRLAYSFNKCPVHGENTSFFNNVAADEDWEIQLAVLREQLEPAATSHSTS
jgi:hypothetical protein